MKLKFLGIAACALALCFTLVGCNSQKVTDFTWYQAAVPDKYELNTSLGSNAAKVSFAKTDEGKELRVNWNGVKDAQGITQAFMEWEGTGSEQLDDMKIGNYTWKVAQNTEASKPKIQFCTDLPDGRVGIVDARGFSDINDKDLQSFVKWVKFADDVSEAYDKAKEVSSGDLKIH